MDFFIVAGLLNNKENMWIRAIVHKNRLSFYLINTSFIMHNIK
jgi:hypothetical protein